MDDKKAKVLFDEIKKINGYVALLGFSGWWLCSDDPEGADERKKAHACEIATLVPGGNHLEGSLVRKLERSELDILLLCLEQVFVSEWIVLSKIHIPKRFQEEKSHAD